MAQIRKIENKKGISYQAVVRKKNYKPIIRTFKKKSEAESWSKDIETQINKGTYIESKEVLLESGMKIETMKQLLEHFRDDIVPIKYQHHEKYEYIINWWIQQIGNIKVTELTYSHINSAKRILMTEKIHKKNGETTRGNNTINKYLMCLSAVLTYATKELELIPQNPMSKKDFTLPKPDGRKRFLSLEEIKIFAEACKNESEVINLFFLILISTGGRYTEVLHLSVIDIDFQNSQIFFIKTKNKESRGVPINKTLLEEIKIYIEKYSITDKIFINKNTGKLYYIRGKLQEIIKNIGLVDFHIHDLRHTTASYIAMNGGSLLDIAEILGHKTLVMARRYSHLTQKHTATVLNRVTSNILPQ